MVSNWDCSLPDVLRGAGLTVDVAVDSASAKSVKPDPRIFLMALERLGVDPRRALHVGDTPAADGDGARAAGIDVRIVDRSGERLLDSTIGSLDGDHPAAMTRSADPQPPPSTPAGLPAAAGVPGRRPCTAR